MTRIKLPQDFVEALNVTQSLTFSSSDLEKSHFEIEDVALVLLKRNFYLFFFFLP